MRVQRYNFFLKPPNISLFFWKNIITPLTIKKQIRKFRIKLIMKFGNLYKLLHLYKANNQQIRNNIHLVGWKPLECLLRRRLVFACSVLKPCYLKNIIMLLFPINYLLYQRFLMATKKCRKPFGSWHFVTNAVGIIIASILYSSFLFPSLKFPHTKECRKQT